MFPDKEKILFKIKFIINLIIKFIFFIIFIIFINIYIFNSINYLYNSCFIGFDKAMCHVLHDLSIFNFSWHLFII